MGLILQVNWLHFAVEPIITEKLFLVLCAAAKRSLSLDSLDSHDALRCVVFSASSWQWPSCYKQNFLFCGVPFSAESPCKERKEFIQEEQMLSLGAKASALTC